MPIQCTTAQGTAALSAAVLGEHFEFTKIVVGAGYIPEGAEPQTLTDVIEPIEIRPIISETRGETLGSAIISFTLSNQDRNDGFYFREIGVYASTESTGEVLYTYLNSENEAEYIPAAGPKAVEKIIRITINVDSDLNVTVLIDTAMYATIDMVNEALALAQQALALAEAANEREIKCPDGGCPALQDLLARIERIENSTYDNMTSNPFSLNFDTLGVTILMEGIWNEPAGRVEC